jgi:hypothetical protein
MRPPGAAVHILAHLFNFERFMDGQLNRDAHLITFVLSDIGNRGNASYLNPIRTNETVRGGGREGEGGGEGKGVRVRVSVRVRVKEAERERLRHT